MLYITFAQLFDYIKYKDLEELRAHLPISVDGKILSNDEEFNDYVQSFDQVEN